MALFVVEHQHPADRCPAGDPRMAPFLLQLLLDAGAKSRGLTIHSSAVTRGKHHLYVVVEGPDEAAVRNYLAPFGQAGSLDVQLASSCEEVVARGAC
jgi:hypothetical protein